MIGALLFISIFLTCWIGLVVNRIIAFRKKSKLNTLIKNRHPNIRRNLSFFENGLSIKLVKSGSHLFLNMFLSFGATKKARAFINNFVDVQAIEDSSDDEAIVLIRKSISLESDYSRIWIIMIGSLLMVLIAKLTWLN